MEREDVSLVKMKCQPGGTFLIPRNCTEVVKERRSIPQSIPAGRSSRRSAAAEVGEGGEAIANGARQIRCLLTEYSAKVS